MFIVKADAQLDLNSVEAVKFVYSITKLSKLIEEYSEEQRMHIVSFQPNGSVTLAYIFHGFDCIIVI